MKPKGGLSLLSNLILDSILDQCKGRASPEVRGLHLLSRGLGRRLPHPFTMSASVPDSLPRGKPVVRGAKMPAARGRGVPVERMQRGVRGGAGGRGSPWLPSDSLPSRPPVKAPPAPPGERLPARTIPAIQEQVTSPNPPRKALPPRGNRGRGRNITTRARSPSPVSRRRSSTVAPDYLVGRPRSKDSDAPPLPVSLHRSPLVEEPVLSRPRASSDPPVVKEVECAPEVPSRLLRGIQSPSTPCSGSKDSLVRVKEKSNRSRTNPEYRGPKVTAFARKLALLPRPKIGRSSTNPPDPSQQEADEKRWMSQPDNPATRIFGVPLDVAVSRGNDMSKPFHLPLVVVLASFKVREHMADEGIFRLSGSHSRIQYWKKRFDLGDFPDVSEEDDPHVISGLLKQYLRELPESILTNKLLPNFEAAKSVGDVKVRAAYTASLMEKLPDINYALLNWMFVLLLNIVSYKQTNFMGVENVALIFGPTLQCSVPTVLCYCRFFRT